MKVELKKVKEMSSMSRETTCFTADVWIDGVKAATVENDGQGGPNRWSDHAAEKKVEAFVKQHPDFAEETFELADQLIGELLMVESERQRAVRDLRTKAFFLRKKGGVGMTNKLTEAQRQMIISKPSAVLEKLNAERFITDAEEIAKTLLTSSGFKLHWS